MSKTDVYFERRNREPQCRVRNVSGAPYDPTNIRHTLTPEELVEFIDSLRDDDLLSPTADCDDFAPAYND
jgi:hypothetical protein